MNIFGYKSSVVMTLAAVALFSQLLLLNISVAQASFDGPAVPVRDYIYPAMISQKFNDDLDLIAANLSWSVRTAAQVFTPKMMSFFGFQDYSYAQSHFSSLTSFISPNNLPVQTGRASLISLDSALGLGHPQVLGAFISGAQ